MSHDASGDGRVPVASAVAALLLVGLLLSGETPRPMVVPVKTAAAVGLGIAVGGAVRRVTAPG